MLLVRVCVGTPCSTRPCPICGRPQHSITPSCAVSLFRSVCTLRLTSRNLRARGASMPAQQLGCGSCDPDGATCCCVMQQPGVWPPAMLTTFHMVFCLGCMQMGPGPNGVGMTLYNLTCGAWDIYNSVFTTQPAVATRLPFPEGAPQILAATQAGPLVQSVRDCDSLQVRDRSLFGAAVVQPLAHLDSIALCSPAGSSALFHQQLCCSLCCACRPCVAVLAWPPPACTLLSMPRPLISACRSGC